MIENGVRRSNLYLVECEFICYTITGPYNRICGRGSVWRNNDWLFSRHWKHRSADFQNAQWIPEEWQIPVKINKNMYFKKCKVPLDKFADLYRKHYAVLLKAIKEDLIKWRGASSS